MGISGLVPETDFRFPPPPEVHDSHEQDQRIALISELRAAQAYGSALLSEKLDLIKRQTLLTQEFEHRLVNSLQLISSLLSMQSRAATTCEAATQLNIAAGRVSALGRVHRRLHLLDHQKNVEFKEYLAHLCEDLSGLLFEERGNCAVAVEAARAEIPTVFAIPLGFIINELITNSAKYAKGSITVRFQPTTSGHSLSVLDNGPGLPEGFDPANGKGLGMKIVQSLVKQIGGELQVADGDGGHGARFTVTFGSPK